MALDQVVHSIQVSFEHRVVFTDHVFAPANRVLAELMQRPGVRARAVVFLDQGVADSQPQLASEISRYFDHHASVLELSAPVQNVVGGEACKHDPRVIENAIRLIHDAKICRHSYVVVVGGGAVLDAICYAASLVHRGVRQVRVPTTVLAQNDAGIGIKNGVGYLGKKNFLGAFYPPHGVINDSHLLKTLDDENWRNGMAEAVKVALIRDREFFEWIEANVPLLIARDLPAMQVLIRRCAELHLRHIAEGGDPFERGSARPLDFGHWSAHKIEQLSDFKIGHGHAVAIGMAIDVLYSERIGQLSHADAGRVSACLSGLGFKFDVGARLGLNRAEGVSQLLVGLDEFQEHLGGELTLSLLQGLGVGFETHEVDRRILAGCVEEIVLPSPAATP